MKKILAISLALIMILSLFACGTGTTSGGTTPSAAPASSAVPASAAATASASAKPFTPKSFTIASPFAAEGAERSIMFAGNLRDLVTAAGGQLVTDSKLQYSTDGVISFVQQQIAAGVDGLFIMPPADSVLPTVAKLCEDAGVYWGIVLRQISDPDIKAMVEASPYYCGTAYVDDVNLGYQAAKALGELGYKKIAIISTQKGDATADKREAGIATACQEYGMTIIAEGRGYTQAADYAAAVQSFLASHSDMDAVLDVASIAAGGVDAALKVLKDANTNVMMGSIDFPSDIEAAYDTGKLLFITGSGTSGSYYHDCLMQAAKLVNAIQGYKILDADGKAATTISTVSIISDIEKAMMINPILNDGTFRFYTVDYITQNLFAWNNTGLNGDGWQKLCDSYDLKAMSPYFAK